MKELVDILKWIWNTPAVRNALIRETGRYVDHTLIPAVRTGLDNYRAAVAAKEASKRKRRLDELRGQIAAYTVDECLQFLDILKEEPNDAVRAQIIELLADRLKALKGGGT